jgi:hypothetical protein
MPATPTRIGFIKEQYRRVIAGPDSGVEARYGSKARDTKEPIETFFVNEADAQACADERLDLLSGERRFVTFDISGTLTGRSLSFNTTTPTANRDVEELLLSDIAAIVSVSVDFEADKTSLSTWG